MTECTDPAEEKSYVVLETNPSPYRQSSPMWNHFHLVKELKDFSHLQNTPGLKKIEHGQENNRLVTLCKICFADKTKPLYNCVFLCYRGQVLNAGAHIKSSHPEVVAPPDSTKSEEEESVVVLTQRHLDPVSPKGIVDRLHYLIYSFVNDAGISAHHACNNDLYKIVDYTVQNASILSKQQSIVMRQHRFQQI